MRNDNVPVFMADIEEQAVMTYKLLANQLTGKIFHDPNIEFDEAEYAFTQVKGNIITSTYVR